MCPSGRRHDLRMDTDTVPAPNQARLANLKPERRSQILYEVAWRHATAFWPVDDNLAALLGTIADPAEDCGIAKRQQAEVAAILLRRARIVGDNDAFERWTSVLETYTELDTDLRAEAFYQRALRARDRLDFQKHPRRSRREYWLAATPSGRCVWQPFIANAASFRTRIASLAKPLGSCRSVSERTVAPCGSALDGLGCNGSHALRVSIVWSAERSRAGR